VHSRAFLTELLLQSNHWLHLVNKDFKGSTRGNNDFKLLLVLLLLGIKLHILDLHLFEGHTEPIDLLELPLFQLEDAESTVFLQG
jgi:hypothetical protein